MAEAGLASYAVYLYTLCSSLDSFINGCVINLFVYTNSCSRHFRNQSIFLVYQFANYVTTVNVLVCGLSACSVLDYSLLTCDLLFCGSLVRAVGQRCSTKCSLYTQRLAWSIIPMVIIITISMKTSNGNFVIVVYAYIADVWCTFEKLQRRSGIWK